MYILHEKYEKLHFNPINGSTYEWNYHNCITAYIEYNVSFVFGFVMHQWEWRITKILMGILRFFLSFFTFWYEQEPILNF